MGRDAKTIAPETVAVRMVVQITGTRNGVDWPGYGEILAATPTEADELIAAGMAISPDQPPLEKTKVWKAF
jgi:hypothetical protein